MKILLYEVREDEKADIARIAKELKVEVVETGEVPSLENAGMAEGCDGVSILGQGTIDVPLLDVWKKLGVECLSTRTIGFNHIVWHMRRALAFMCAMQAMSRTECQTSRL